MHVVRFALELVELAFFTPNNVSVSESDESDACAVAGLRFVSDASDVCHCRIEIRDHQINNNIPLMLNSYHSKRLNPRFAFRCLFKSSVKHCHHDKNNRQLCR